MTCQCESCSSRRQDFTNVLKSLSSGIGCSKKKINRHLDQLPEEYVKDMQALMSRMRENPGKLTPLQHEFIQSYKGILRKFVKPPPQTRKYLGQKRKFNKKQIPFAQAYAMAYHDNPAAFKQALHASIGSKH